MEDVEVLLARLDAASAARVRKALPELLLGAPAQAGLAALTAEELRRRIAPLPTLTGTVVGTATERHETAWALADFFDAAGLPVLAEVCRSARTHALIAASEASAEREDRATAWVKSMGRGRATMWEQSLAVLRAEPLVPPRLELAVTAVRSLLDAVGPGVTLTDTGHLPPTMALALDTKFGWSDEHPPRPPRGETDLPMLLFLDEHLRQQGLLTVRGRRLQVASHAERLRGDGVRLWGAVVAPRPRWHLGFEQDALAVLAGTLLRGPELTRDQLRDEMTFLLSGKWQGTEGRTVEEGVRGVELAWYRVGVTLGWWDREGGLWSAKVRLGAFGRAAAASAFWAVVSAQ